MVKNIHAMVIFQNLVYTTVSVACWAGAAVHQAQARITLQRTAHLNNELRALLQNYFCDLASIDTMLTDMLVSFLKLLYIGSFCSYLLFRGFIMSLKKRKMFVIQTQDYKMAASYRPTFK